MTGAMRTGFSMQAADNIVREYPFHMEPVVPRIFLWNRRMRSEA